MPDLLALLQLMLYGGQAIPLDSDQSLPWEAGVSQHLPLPLDTLAASRRAAPTPTLNQSFPQQAIALNISDDASIRRAAATAAYSLQSMYNGNRTGGGGVLGKFPYPPFFWWLSGASWDGMLHYWLYTGDESYYNVTWEALVSQISGTNNYLPLSEKFDEGNDDIAFWAFGAMFAAEHSFRPPPPPKYPSWLQICDNVFNDFVTRWRAASDTCGGGLRWQVFPSSAGWDYKNSISNGGFFQLAARLARYTGNATYFSWASKVWDWTEAVGLIDDEFNVYDGAGIDDDNNNCTSPEALDRTRWSYNVAIYLYGAAVMHNLTAVPVAAEAAGGGPGNDGSTSSSIWTKRTDGLVAAAERSFFSPYANSTRGVMYEQACEPGWKCDVDQFSFKAYLARWLADTTLMAPHTKGKVGKLLKTSAAAAVRACTSTSTSPSTDTDAGTAAAARDDVECGAHWYLGGEWDGTTGVGQALSVMEVVQTLLVNGTRPPAFNWTSLGGPGTGTGRATAVLGR
ncbi:hypothetical protein LTR99_004996 [Exophiala xenobiotica]|nr:hypothetical protein LTR96_003831 [Exophiala xenobiotica]KAK5303235.1 hypothetical protein LTR99_004996 [Exophiala xenobiotica]KAK5333353.1 hypothetical protein LTR98_010558 [Exophiala xenobiotica]KAK5436337.1 hypothetical protein LTR34_001967 [Exophiala xenobiotica]KAK5551704.1 hypothetical protein LTR46_010299 [Exophiala xenobiotica]